MKCLCRKIYFEQNELERESLSFHFGLLGEHAYNQYRGFNIEDRKRHAKVSGPKRFVHSREVEASD